MRLTRQTKRRLVWAIIIGALLGLLWLWVHDDGSTDDVRQMPATHAWANSRPLQSVLPNGTPTWNRW